VILPEGPADGGTEVVTDVGVLLAIFFGIEEVTSAEGVIAAKLVGISVELIRTATCNDVDDGAGVAAKLCVEVVGDDTELLGRIRIC